MQIGSVTTNILYRLISRKMSRFNSDCGVTKRLEEQGGGVTDSLSYPLVGDSAWMRANT